MLSSLLCSEDSIHLLIDRLMNGADAVPAVGSLWLGADDRPEDDSHGGDGQGSQ